MKKSYLMIAAAAGMMLTACTSEDDYAAQNAAVEQGDGAVLFDTYLSNNSTRAGETGIMTTTTLQTTGFGIMAYQGAIDGIGGAASVPTGKPNFMWNQYVGYKESNWMYTPLKYWPNETVKDKQSTAASSTDREGLSFYAYAPYAKVSNPAATGTMQYDGHIDFDDVTATSVGLIGATKNSEDGDPKVYYRVACGYGKTGDSEVNKSTLPSKSVDLLWGVSSGFSYHPVNAETETKNGSGEYVASEIITKTQGMPIEHMYKPALDEKIKFDFKHALARIGLTVVGAFDQKAQGGTLDDKTRVTIEEITVTGDAFAIEGVLNLDNTEADRALWELNDATKYNFDTTVPADGTNDAGQIRVTMATDDEMNPELRHVDETHFPNVAGVKATEQYVLTQNEFKAITDPTPVFDWKKTYYGENGALIDLQPASGPVPVVWTKDGDYSWVTFDKSTGVYTETDEPAWSIYGTEPITAKGEPVAPGKLKVDMKATYYKRTGASAPYVYTPKAVSDMTFDVDNKLTEEGIYTLAFMAPVPKYKTGEYYELTTTPRYFMVIPTTGNTPENKNVTVTIKYHVTTADNKINAASDTDDKVVNVSNVISQVVTLEKFTNGKAYNLKLILGLTSVKIDADVTNWEVGTVESNLPQNLE